MPPSGDVVDLGSVSASGRSESSLSAGSCEGDNRMGVYPSWRGEAALSNGNCREDDGEGTAEARCDELDDAEDESEDDSSEAGVNEEEAGGKVYESE